MQEGISQALMALVGLPLWNAGRLPGLAWFHFGGCRAIAGRGGTVRKVGTYALHIQCPWRIVGPAGIVVGWNDRFFAAGDDPYKDYGTFDWESAGANRCDERLARFLAERAAAPQVVAAVQGDSIGGFRASLSGQFALEVFPDTSVEGENWRLFQPGMPESHFVVTASGIRGESFPSAPPND